MASAFTTIVRDMDYTRPFTVNIPPITNSTISTVDERKGPPLQLQRPVMTLCALFAYIFLDRLWCDLLFKQPRLQSTRRSSGLGHTGFTEKSSPGVDDQRGLARSNIRPADFDKLQELGWQTVWGSNSTAIRDAGDVGNQHGGGPDESCTAREIDVVDAGAGSEHPAASDPGTSMVIRHRKRRRGTGRDEDEDGDETPGNGPVASAKARRKGQRLACPFFKHDPSKYTTTRSCAGPGFDNISRVKEHLSRNHTLQGHECSRCLKHFNTEAARVDHQTPKMTCEEHVRPNDGRRDFLSQEQYKALRLRGSYRQTKQMSEADRWLEVYRVIFPEVPADQAPSPYYGTEDSLRSISQLRSMPQLLLEELPSLVLASLHTHNNVETAVQDAVRAFVNNVEFFPTDNARPAFAALSPRPVTATGPADGSAVVSSTMADSETLSTPAIMFSHGMTNQHDPMLPQSISAELATAHHPVHQYLLGMGGWTRSLDTDCNNDSTGAPVRFVAGPNHDERAHTTMSLDESLSYSSTSAALPALEKDPDSG